MTDHHAGYIVVLSEDIREDDAEEGVLNAIRMIRGVLSVEPVVADMAQGIGRARSDAAWRDALWDLARNGPRGSEQR